MTRPLRKQRRPSPLIPIWLMPMRGWGMLLILQGDQRKLFSHLRRQFVSTQSLRAGTCTVWGWRIARRGNMSWQSRQRRKPSKATHSSLETQYVHIHWISCSPQSTQYSFLSRRLMACFFSLHFLIGMSSFTTSPQSAQKRTGTSARL